MIHFFGVLELGRRRRVGASEAPNKTRLFSLDDPIDSRDAILSPAEQDALILTCKQPDDAAEERRFT